MTTEPVSKARQRQMQKIEAQHKAWLAAQRQSILDKITATGRRFVRTVPILSGAELRQQTFEPLNLNAETSARVRLRMLIEEAGRNDISWEEFVPAFFAGVNAPRTAEEQSEFNNRRAEPPDASICVGLPKDVGEELLAELTADWKEMMARGAVLPQ